MKRINYPVSNLNKHEGGVIVCQCTPITDDMQPTDMVECTNLRFNWGTMKFRTYVPPMFVITCPNCGEEYAVTLTGLQGNIRHML